MKKNYLIIFVLASFFVLSLISCGYKSISHGQEITESQSSQIIDGKTTKKEIFMKFGEPSKTMDDESVFFYSWTRGGKGHFLGFGSGSAESKTLVVVFNDDEIVSSHKITRGATSSGATVGD